MFDAVGCAASDFFKCSHVAVKPDKTLVSLVIVGNPVYRRATQLSRKAGDKQLAQPWIPD
jgi:hypothetical protein